jgi:hypothetical protein
MIFGAGHRLPMEEGQNDSGIPEEQTLGGVVFTRLRSVQLSDHIPV